MNAPCSCHRPGHGIHRRTFLADLGMGFTGLALGAMLQRDGFALASTPLDPVGRGVGGERWSPPDGQPHFTPKAKSVIWLFMNGGVSHLETFDPKPMLTKYAGKTIAETPFKDVQNPEKLKLARVVVVNDANGQQRNKLYPLQVGFRKHGQSGIEVSDWLPHLGDCVDDIAVVRSMYTTDDNHGAQTQFHSGRHMLDGEFPTLGAWVHYGLGSLNDNLPQFISHGQARILEREGRPLPRPGPRRRAAADRPGQPARLRQAGRRRDGRGAEDRLRPGRQAESSCGPSSTPTTRRWRRASSRMNWPSACRSRCPKC